MWHWDQGHLQYFQYEAIRQMALFVKNNNFKVATNSELILATGLNFAAPLNYTPWRNYSRILKQTFLISNMNDKSEPTAVADILSKLGVVTCDEYLHFLVSASTEPSPALKGWTPDSNFRYPLLFTLKYLLSKQAIFSNSITDLNEIISAYCNSGFTGDEDENDFAALISQPAGSLISHGDKARQARESIKVISQISYIFLKNNEITLSLNPQDARNIFLELAPIIGPRAQTADDEIRRIASLFSCGSTYDFFDYPNTVINDIIESGFKEGSKVKKTHLTIERNSSLRNQFFATHPSAICDVCHVDTSIRFPWTDRVLDLHHLLPLSSGTRVENSGTVFDDLVPVCPTCHRATHRFYDTWLLDKNKLDFNNQAEARSVYNFMKSNCIGFHYA